MSVILFPMSPAPTPEERNQRRIKKWDNSGPILHTLMMLAWILELFLMVFLAACFCLAGAAILTPIPFLIRLKIFTCIPCGTRSKSLPWYNGVK